METWVVRMSMMTTLGHIRCLGKLERRASHFRTMGVMVAEVWGLLVWAVCWRNEEWWESHRVLVGPLCFPYAFCTLFEMSQLHTCLLSPPTLCPPQWALLSQSPCPSPLCACIPGFSSHVTIHCSQLSSYRPVIFLYLVHFFPLCAEPSKIKGLK